MNVSLTFTVGLVIMGAITSFFRLGVSALTIIYFLIAFLITAFVCLLFPVIYVMQKGTVDRKKAAKLALINLIVCVIIFVVCREIIGAPLSYYINMFIVTSMSFWVSEEILWNKLKRKKNFGKNNDKDFINNSNDDNKTTKENKQKKEEEEEVVDWINMK